ncbi:hypothetical protein BaRGS_00007110 [Batillaria attramentaria]|uniref:Uncharacterized protein n=1 Tax=Batillaria attramentaria TaxID=370345 RepID=A0ABD0LPS1_9CAEN
MLLSDSWQRAREGEDPALHGLQVLTTLIQSLAGLTLAPPPLSRQQGEMATGPPKPRPVRNIDWHTCSLSPISQHGVVSPVKFTGAPDFQSVVLSTSSVCVSPCCYRNQSRFRRPKPTKWPWRASHPTLTDRVFSEVKVMLIPIDKLSNILTSLAFNLAVA